VDCHVASLLAMTAGGAKALSISNLQNFSDVILHAKKAQMKPASGAYVLVRERARRSCNVVSVWKNELKIVKDKVRRFYKWAKP
jgi:hypothetical protein